MRRLFLSRAALLMVLILLLVVPSLQASGPRGGAEPVRSVFSWDVLAQAWSFLTGVWSANGCEFDPNGRCVPSQPMPTVDNGCEADPNGRCGN
jgi:hypothetical protein